MSSNPYREALELLRKNGWTKNHYYHNGSYCLVGALVAVTGMDYYEIEDRDGEFSRISKIAKEQFPDRYHYCTGIPGVNDNDDTHFEDVEMFLEKAAVQYEEVI